MKLIPFNKQGGRIKVCFKFTGLIAASYTFTLWESGSNDIVMEKKGNNINPVDDCYDLPLPTDKNDGRIIDLLTSFKGLNTGKATPYSITIEVYQDGNLLGTESESGNCNGTQQSQLYAKLVG